MYAQICENLVLGVWGFDWMTGRLIKELILLRNNLICLKNFIILTDAYHNYVLQCVLTCIIACE